MVVSNEPGYVFLVENWWSCCSYIEWYFSSIFIAFSSVFFRFGERYYRDGDFGIRIENLLEIQDCSPESEDSTEKKFLKFAKLTLIPIQQNLIDVTLLTVQEMDWLDAYHKLVFEKVSPLLERGSLAMKWLEKSCAEIERSP